MVSLVFRYLCPIVLLVSLSFALRVDQEWVVMNQACNSPANGGTFEDCGTFGGYNDISQSGTQYGGIIVSQNKLSGYKPFYGIGAAITESSAYLLDQLSSSNNNAFQDILQKTRDFSSFRIPVGSSDYATQEWTFVSDDSADWDMSTFDLRKDVYKRPILNGLLSVRNNEPVSLTFSLWTPPIWMKKWNEFSYAELDDSVSLCRSYAGFANYWIAFLKNLKNYINPNLHGVVQQIYITIQNEPFQNPGADLPGCSMSVQDQVEVTRIVADELNFIDFGGLPTPKILVHDHNWDQTAEAMDTYQQLNSAAAGVAFHAYDGEFTNQTQFRNNNPNAEIHLTELSGKYDTNYEGGGPWGTLNWDMGNIIFGSLKNYGQSVTYWNLALDDNAGPRTPNSPGYCDSCNGMFRISGSNQVYNQPRYYTFGLVSKCIPYGAERVEVSLAGGLDPNVYNVFAYKKDNNYCVLVNNGGGGINLYLEVGGQQFYFYIGEGSVNAFTVYE